MTEKERKAGMAQAARRAEAERIGLWGRKRKRKN
jgi:hypothetical protein